MVILDILAPVQRDHTVVKKEIRRYDPYLKIFSKNDEIRILINNQTTFLLLNESYLWVEGTVTELTGSK